MNILVTGGAGFIGSALVRMLLDETEHHVVCVDALTYAGNLESIPGGGEHPRLSLEIADICDRAEMDRILTSHRPGLIFHLAAESHVDRSIDGPAVFVQTNVVGTQVLLEAATTHWASLDEPEKRDFRFHHVSTDEVFGDLDPSAPPFSETTPYAPSSPYAATKAASDHLVSAWHRTYGLPVLITNCSNNYGPYQFPEKLIPHMILKALGGEPLPVYGDGAQVRDWIHVEDHVRGVYLAGTKGRLGEAYLFGGDAEMRNLEVVRTICSILDEVAPQRRSARVASYSELIEFVPDRPGHDRRYAVDSSKAVGELGWTRKYDFEAGLRATVEWYLSNEAWWGRVLSGEYRLQRLGQS